MIQNVLAITRDVQIRVAVIVIVADRRSHSVVGVSGIRQTGCLRNVGEAAVAVLPVKPIPVPRIMTIEVFRRGHGARQAAAIHEKNVQQAVIVIVEQGYSSGHGFDQVLLRCGRILEGEIQSTRRLQLENGRRESRKEY